MMQVTKTEEVFDKSLLDKIDKWDPEERRDQLPQPHVLCGLGDIHARGQHDGVSEGGR